MIMTKSQADEILNTMEQLRKTIKDLSQVMRKVKELDPVLFDKACKEVFGCVSQE